MNQTTSRNTPLRVIIVEDEVATGQQLEDFMKEQHDVIITGSCGTVQEAIVLVRTTQPDLLFLDTQLPDGTGFDILEHISLHMRVIFLAHKWEYAIRALQFGAIEYLLKPFNTQEIINSLVREINAPALIQEQIDITLGRFRASKVPDRIALSKIFIGPGGIKDQLS